MFLSTQHLFSKLNSKFLSTFWVIFIDLYRVSSFNISSLLSQFQAVQVVLQTIQNNPNAVVSHPLPTFSGTIDEVVYLLFETDQWESVACGWVEVRKEDGKRTTSRRCS